jgi:hypothetical protein
VSNKNLLRLKFIFQAKYKQGTQNVAPLIILVIQKTAFNRPDTISINKRIKNENGIKLKT